MIEAVAQRGVSTLRSCYKKEANPRLPSAVIVLNSWLYTAKGLGMPDLPLVIVPHPIGGISPNEVETKADNIIDTIVAQLSG